MRVALLCQGTVLQPTLEALYSQNLLAGLGVPDCHPAICQTLEQAARHAAIPFVRIGSGDLAEQLAPWLDQTVPDVVCTMGFPYKIPETLLGKPKYGFFNLHGGALPRYRGPDPVFWQIRNREQSGAVTIHRIAAELDSGGIAHAVAIPIGPEDTYGLHMQRLGATLPRVLIEFVQQLAILGNELPLNEQVAAAASYWKRPTETDLTVDWNQSAAEVGALVRACNPIHGGALSSLKGVPLRLLQVTAGDRYEWPQATPGLIVEANREKGLRIACGEGQTLFLDIVCAEDGFYTGAQLVKVFGLGAGDRLQ